MGLQKLADDRRGRRRLHAYSGDYTISGAAGSRIVNGSNAGNVSGISRWYGGGSTSVDFEIRVHSYSGPVSVTEEYDPAFVAEILAADAAPAEEGFDNVVDLLDWLNRD